MCLVKNGTFLALCRVFYLIELIRFVRGGSKTNGSEKNRRFLKETS